MGRPPRDIGAEPDHRVGDDTIQDEDRQRSCDVDPSVKVAFPTSACDKRDGHNTLIAWAAEKRSHRHVMIRSPYPGQPMLHPGARFGSYEIVSLLGVGGMGEVYRARDTKLHRDVALKVLPDALRNHPDRLARFEREARLLASLNHPNIAAIHQIEESGSITALVLELVEGSTLADRLTQGAVQREEVLAIASQIVSALEAAHELGIVHRDLKPANVKLRPDGMVKVLDFGLAKALEAPTGAAGDSQSPTRTAMTQEGRVLGTAAYMSPERARGLPADQRADVWAFGCVLYEMLSGRRAFAGEHWSDILAGVPAKLRLKPPRST